jgi:hypothetical protein
MRDRLIWRRIVALIRASRWRYFDGLDRPDGPGGVRVAIIVIDPRTSNPAAVILRGRAVMFVDTQTGAGDPARYGIAKAPACAAWMHRRLLLGEAPTAHSVAS